MMRAYNFGAGPATLPLPILIEVQEELLNWQGLGMSVMEIGHRTRPIQHLMEELETEFREILSIPKQYHVIFLGGAARTQFAMIPMNLLSEQETAGYCISGLWSSMAYEEALKIKHAYVVASSEAQGFTHAPLCHSLEWANNTSYIYYVPNETVNGVRFSQPPKTKDIPLVADMTSCLLSEPINIEDYGLIFAGAQKNIAIAGLTMVIIRSDLINHSTHSHIPTMLDYKTHIEHHSVYATPPVFNCYIALKMMKWIKAQGGVNALYQMNLKKADALYQYIDSSPFYSCSVQKESRSLMNVCFTMKRQDLIETFITRAQQNGLSALQGHRTVGGLRASLYNAMPLEGVMTLIQFMQDFSLEFL